MTYLEYVSQFTIYDNPPKKDGYERHHIVPVSEQVESDDRQVYLTVAQHMWAHILYDKEYGTHTANRFLSICGKPANYFDCWEKCLEHADILRNKRELSKKAMSTPEVKKKLSDSHKGKSTWNKGKPSTIKGLHWWNNGSENKVSLECPGPEWVSGSLPRSQETRDKQSKAKLGKIKSEEHKRKIGTTQIGRHFYNNGKREVRAYSCPDGFVKGRLKRTA